jgi:hypothetical protein
MLEHFYHGTIRKVVIAFASLFNGIYISRKDGNGTEIERIKVPIAYGPQQKFLRRLDRIGTDFDQQAVRIETYLPRISFEIGTVQYDSTRKLNSIQQTVGYVSRDKMKARYERVPYNLTMNLGVMAKGMEDCLQITEQIIPYFTPEYVVTIKAIEGLDMDVDIPIVLSSVAFSDGDDGSYGDYATRKINFAALSFNAKIYLYGPVKESTVITHTDINIFDGKDFGKDTSTIRKYADIGITAAAGITSGSFDPSLTGQVVMTIREYPPTPWT